QGDNPSYNWGNTSQYTGIFFRRSVIRLADVGRGTSYTFLAGEKYINPDNYFSGADGGDNENLYVGFDNNIGPGTPLPPLQDVNGFGDTFRFGSAHIAGLNMLNCDGSVSLVAYTVDQTLWKNSGNRNPNYP